MPNSDNQARNDDRLKFAMISNKSHVTEPRYGRVKHVTEPRYGRVKRATPRGPVARFMQPYLGPVARDWMLEITANFKRSSFLAWLSELGI